MAYSPQARTGFELAVWRTGQDRVPRRSGMFYDLFGQGIRT